MMTMTSRTDPRLQLEPASRHVRIALFLLVLVLPIVLVTASLLFAQATSTPQRLIGDNLTTTTATTVGSVALLVMAVWWILDRSLRRHRIHVDANGIEIATTFYTRKLSLDQLKLSQARVVSLDEHTELKPMFKTNATALPGFQSGWFRLRNRNKALVARAGGNRVVWIPTDAGYDLLLQPRQPAALLQYLQALETPGPR